MNKDIYGSRISGSCLKAAAEAMFPILYFLPYENLHMEIENSKCLPFYFANVEIRDLYFISFPSIKFKCTTTG